MHTETFKSDTNLRVLRDRARLEGVKLKALPTPAHCTPRYSVSGPAADAVRQFAKFSDY